MKQSRSDDSFVGLPGLTNARRSPGKQTRTQALQFRGGAPSKGDSALRTAARGVEGASDTLPFGSQIQMAFGRHDVGDVRAAVGGPAAKASAEMGASAYATGNRVAFAGAPDLHTAAHEAAHVVQQRAGVQLKGGVGQSGDAYERHADRVADMVVGGESAEAALDEMSRTGAGTPAVQRHDSPHHVAIGNSVSGESVVILGVEFGPGHCAALVDYVGPIADFVADCVGRAENEKDEEVGNTTERVATMLQMLDAGNEDTLEWNIVTEGRYSELSKVNDDHFSPGEDGAGVNHSASFVEAAATALRMSAKGELEVGRQHLYTAEHFLQDAFSSGHLVAQPDIDAALADLVGAGEVAAMMPVIASQIFDEGAAIISMYGIETGGFIMRLGRATFMTMATYVFATDNDENALAGAGLRKFVHERLDLGVKVSSPAHPEAWVMYGDHALNNEEQPITVTQLQQALADLRDLFDGNGTSPVADPEGQVAALLAHHKPMPTDDGEDTIAAAIRSATQSRFHLIAAMVDSGLDTLAGGLDTAVYENEYIVRVENPNELREGPDDIDELDRAERDPDERFVPENRPSYISELGDRSSINPPATGSGDSISD